MADNRRHTFHGVTGDQYLQQRIDHEIKMRDGTAKLLAASKRPNQMLEAAKNLLASNSRMLAYMTELQQRKTHQVLSTKTRAQEEDQLPCKAKLVLSDIRVPLMWKDTDHFKNKGDHRRYAVFCLVKVGTEIRDTQLVKDVDRGMTDITFDDVFTFEDVGPDFECQLELYCHKLYDDLSIASTPKKLRKRLGDISSSVSRSVGRRLSGLKDGQDLLANMLIGPKFECLAKATLLLKHVCSGVGTFDLDVEPSSSTNESLVPLFGHICCRLAARPHCLVQDTASGTLLIKDPAMTSWDPYWCRLRNKTLCCWSDSACADTTPPALTIGVSQETQVSWVDPATCAQPFPLNITRWRDSGVESHLVAAESKADHTMWWEALQQHLLDQVLWKQACDSVMDMAISKPPKTPVYLRKGAASALDTKQEADSPMTRMLNRLSVDEDMSEQQGGDKASGSGRASLRHRAHGSSAAGKIARRLLDGKTPPAKDEAQKTGPKANSADNALRSALDNLDAAKAAKASEAVGRSDSSCSSASNVSSSSSSSSGVSSMNNSSSKPSSSSSSGVSSMNNSSSKPSSSSSSSSSSSGVCSSTSSSSSVPIAAEQTPTTDSLVAPAVSAPPDVATSTAYCCNDGSPALREALDVVGELDMILEQGCPELEMSDVEEEAGERSEQTMQQQHLPGEREQAAPESNTAASHLGTTDTIPPPECIVIGDDSRQSTPDADLQQEEQTVLFKGAPDCIVIDDESSCSSSIRSSDAGAAATSSSSSSSRSSVCSDCLVLEDSSMEPTVLTMQELLPAALLSQCTPAQACWTSADTEPEHHADEQEQQPPVPAAAECADSRGQETVHVHPESDTERNVSEDAEVTLVENNDTTEQRTPVSDEGTVADQGKPVENEEATETDEVVLVENAEVTETVQVTPFENEGVPETDQLTPVENEGVPETDQLTPVENEGVTETVQVTPVENEGVTETVQVTPVENEGMTETVQVTPVENEGMTETVHVTPVENEVVTETDQATPVENEGVTETDQVTPAENEEVTTDQVTPVENEGVTETDQLTPVENEGVTETDQVTPVENEVVTETDQVTPVENEGVTETDQVTPVANEGVTDIVQGTQVDKSTVSSVDFHQQEDELTAQTQPPSSKKLETTV